MAEIDFISVWGMELDFCIQCRDEIDLAVAWVVEIDLISV